MAGQLDQLQVIGVRKTGVDETFHQGSGFGHPASKKDSHAWLDMGQDLLGRNNEVFPLNLYGAALFFFHFLAITDFEVQSSAVPGLRIELECRPRIGEPDEKRIKRKAELVVGSVVKLIRT